MALFSGIWTRGRLLQFWGVVVVSTLSTSPAQAYVDPNSISMFLQLVVASVAGGLWVLKVYWQRLKGFFGFNLQRDDTGIDTPDKGD